MFNRTEYKPLMFADAQTLMKEQANIVWTIDDISLIEDTKDFILAETEERDVLFRIFKFFTQADVNVQYAQTKLFNTFIGCPEVIGMLSSFMMIETIHMEAYARVIDNFTRENDEFYKEFQNVPVFKSLHERTKEISLDPITTKEELIDFIVEFFLIPEGVYLNTFFVLLLSFYKFNSTYAGLDTIVSYSMRDENIHVRGMRSLCMELNRQYFENKLSVQNDKLFLDVWETQQEIIKYMYGTRSDINTITQEDLFLYTKFNVYNSIRGSEYTIQNEIKNPFQWIDSHLKSRIVDIFSSEETRYRRANSLS